MPKLRGLREVQLRRSKYAKRSFFHSLGRLCRRRRSRPCQRVLVVSEWSGSCAPPQVYLRLSGPALARSLPSFSQSSRARRKQRLDNKILPLHFWLRRAALRRADGRTDSGLLQFDQCPRRLHWAVFRGTLSGRASEGLGLGDPRTRRRGLSTQYSARPGKEGQPPIDHASARQSTPTIRDRHRKKRPHCFIQLYQPDASHSKQRAIFAFRWLRSSRLRQNAIGRIYIELSIIPPRSLQLTLR